MNSTHLNFHLHIPISNALPVDRQWVTVLNSSIPILDGVYEVSETSGTNAITVSRNRGGGIQDGEYTLLLNDEFVRDVLTPIAIRVHIGTRKLRKQAHTGIQVR